ncbi:LacI family DNA-binding transcriptional regulator [Streptomyces litchfieldiae]|uniref:LacI family DNA-binding transcriptional regulator n=1 Tax=Streptomyces litchfieldiae TaxID=3075543 RepID=A0ABU2MYI0_9ACTN|nr:LacI family DNA-binding transcriptional regulator [Streptomyces sp. DSM 44938]MDT0346333.1 LacI family DNA-binding transcriptional regulator [Streptomyces sp. DSM 44938]
MDDTKQAEGAGRRRITQADVAQHAGVSTGIVSSVINGRDYGTIGFGERTRDPVWRSVRELGYVPNIAARSLARGGNRLIGVFTPGPLLRPGANDGGGAFLTGIEEEAGRAGYHLLLFTGPAPAAGRRSVYSGGVNTLQLADGSVLIGADTFPGDMARLAAESYPFLLVGERDAPGARGPPPSPTW